MDVKRKQFMHNVARVSNFLLFVPRNKFPFQFGFLANFQIYQMYMIISSKQKNSRRKHVRGMEKPPFRIHGKKYTWVIRAFK